MKKTKQVLSNSQRRAARKQFKKEKQPWHPFSLDDYKALKPKD